MKDFYVTLISNSSIETYSWSKASSFIVQLPRKISLNENWVVGLAELHFSYNFFNVTENNNSFTYTCGRNTYTHKIPVGFYNSVGDILTEILKKTEKELGRWLEYDSTTNRVRVIHTDEITKKLPFTNGHNTRTNEITKTNPLSDNDNCNELTAIKFHGRLALQLGFIPDGNVLKYKFSPYVGNVYYGIPEQMYVYCDIIEPQIVGYESSQIIKIINTSEKELKFGSSCFHGFQKIHYIPVMKKEFDTIQIDIRDITGEYFPFRHGITTVKLHFKEIKPEFQQ